MSALDIVYASRPVGVAIIRALMIQINGQEPICLCQGYKDQWLVYNGVARLFKAGSLSVSLPAMNATGNQTIKFGVQGAKSEANKYVDIALETNDEAIMTYLEYLSTDKTAPARRPYVMTVTGGAFEGESVIFEGGYYDLLNSAWPRDRYTSENAPGVQWQ